MGFRFKELFHELKHHSPFTLLATVLATLIVLIISSTPIIIPDESFEFFHVLHLVASSMVSAGIFYKYKKNVFYTVFVGVLSAIFVGSISDVLFPYLAGLILGIDISFHLPILEDTFVILGFSIFGTILGLNFKYTKFPHSLHVFFSVFASLFYLTVFSSSSFLVYGIIVFISVIIPCCLSDIVLPFFFLGKKINHCNCSIK